MSLHVLVTGAAGYIGSVLVRQLLEQGYSVTGFDNLMFGGQSLVGLFNHPRFRFLRGDLRSPSDVAGALKSVEAVVHLAAIVGDPACKAMPDDARAINFEGSCALHDRAIATTSVRRFVFASTCSNYGRMEANAILNEESPLAPLSIYAETKVAVEQRLLAADSPAELATTVLRFSTVYGVSPRMRFDLTVNEFVREVVLGKELVIFGEQFWRPYCHVEDLARSCVCVLRADTGAVKGQVFGVGDTRENYQKQMIAAEILKQISSARIRYVNQDIDPRDYRVDFSKIRNALGFAITKTVPNGIAEIRNLLLSGLLTDPYAAVYRNT